MAKRRYVTRLTGDGRVTIPADVRRLLGLEPGQTVTLEVTGSEVRIKPARLSLDSLYGAVKPLTTPEDFEHIEQVYEAALVEAVLRRDWDTPEEDAAWASL
jgi:AbrB family looped-hinge helix DNA binding protein